MNGDTGRSDQRRQMATPYAELSEDEKESDRIEARKVLALMIPAVVRLPTETR